MTSCLQYTDVAGHYLWAFFFLWLLIPHASVGAVGKLSKLRTALVSVQPFAGNVWKFHFIEKKRYRWILCQDSNSQCSLRISLDLGATSFPGCIELGLETIRKPWNLLICVDFRKCTKSIFAYIISILWIYRLSCVKLLFGFVAVPSTKFRSHGMMRFALWRLLEQMHCPLDCVMLCAWGCMSSIWAAGWRIVQTLLLCGLNRCESRWIARQKGALHILLLGKSIVVECHWNWNTSYFRVFRLVIFFDFIFS